MEGYVTGENIDGTDVAFWYRAGFRHEGPADCELAGPTLQPSQGQGRGTIPNDDRICLPLLACLP